MGFGRRTDGKGKHSGQLQGYVTCGSQCESYDKFQDRDNRVPKDGDLQIVGPKGLQEGTPG